MSEYKFTYEDTEYILNANNCSELINDEEKPVKGINVDSILNMLNEADDVDLFSYILKVICRVCNLCK